VSDTPVAVAVAGFERVRLVAVTAVSVVDLNARAGERLTDRESLSGGDKRGDRGRAIGQVAGAGGAAIDYAAAPSANEFSGGAELLHSGVAAVEDVDVAVGLVDGESTGDGRELAGSASGHSGFADFVVGLAGQADLVFVFGVIAVAGVDHVPAPDLQQLAVGAEDRDPVAVAGVELGDIDGARIDAAPPSLIAMPRAELSEPKSKIGTLVAAAALWTPKASSATRVATRSAARSR
jgi:hypothetical protein